MRILVFQHLDVEHPGAFRQLWEEDGHEWTPIELDIGEPIPPLEAFDILVSMGGPMDVWQEDVHPWIGSEKQAIRRWVAELKRPFLGVCLGHQLLAEALGGKVTPMRQPEVGLSNVQLTDEGKRDSILAGFAEEVEVFQWHGAEISILPERTEVLAGNSACPIQAIRWGHHAYGFQYHCEITASTVSDWERIPEYKESLERALGKQKAAKLSNLVAPKLRKFNEATRLINQNFMKIVNSLRSAEG